MKQTQREWTIAQLKEHGEVTRNQALSVFFSRLGAVICDLRKEGWEIETSHRDGDYVYKLIEPAKRIVWECDLIDGVRVPRKIFVPV